jgi:hypothetical protein
LQKHYAAIQALALQEEAVDFDDEEDDRVQPAKEVRLRFLLCVPT